MYRIYYNYYRIILNGKCNRISSCILIVNIFMKFLSVVHFYKKVRLAELHLMNSLNWKWALPLSFWTAQFEKVLISSQKLERFENPPLKIDGFCQTCWTHVNGSTYMCIPYAILHTLWQSKYVGLKFLIKLSGISKIFPSHGSFTHKI